MAGTRLSEHGGRIRTQQNWIGGSDFNPCSAAFVPPPPEAVPGLLDDLMAFCNQDMLPALAQAAIAHAQFETIHPFVDGNGRTGRVLLHLVLRRRRVGLRRRRACLFGVGDLGHGLCWRLDGYPIRRSARLGRCDGGGSTDGSPCLRQHADEQSKTPGGLKRVFESSKHRGSSASGPTRRDSTVRHLIQALPGMPVLSTASAARATDRSFQATSQAVKRFDGCRRSQADHSG